MQQTDRSSGALASRVSREAQGCLRVGPCDVVRGGEVVKSYGGVPAGPMIVPFPARPRAGTEAEHAGGTAETPEGTGVPIRCSDKSV